MAAIAKCACDKENLTGRGRDDFVRLGTYANDDYFIELNELCCAAFFCILFKTEFWDSVTLSIPGSYICFGS
jgi:hypothetical protein